MPIEVASSCPNEAALAGFVSGALAEPAATELERHLETCPRCQALVDERLRQRDSLLDALVQPQTILTERDQSGLARLIEAAQADSSGGAAAGAEVSAGQVLGNYVLLEKLGQGGMGSVFKARHRRLDRIVCLKVLHPGQRQSPEALERFRREAQAVAALRHPNIVVAHDADEADGTPFLVMEFVAGCDLAQRVARDGPLDEPAAVAIVLQAARALDHAHRHGIVHRDIKPHNLHLDDTGNVKVLDMGLARFDSYLGLHPDATEHSSVTGSGIIMGTVDYMAPEQALNSRKADGRSDIYSLGCTLHYLLSGQVVYGGETLMEKLVAHRERAVPSLRAAARHVSPGLEAIFERMVAKDPARRYATMAEVVADLEALEAGRTPAALRLRRGTPRRGRRLLAAAAFLSLLAGGVGLWTLETALRPVPAKPAAKEAARPPAAPVGNPLLRGNGGPGRALVVLAHEWFIEDDFTETRAMLQRRGIDYATASTKPGAARPKHGACPPVEVDLTLDKVNVDDFDAILFLGGNPFEFTKDERNAAIVQRIVEDSLARGRAVAGMSVGVNVLSDLGALKDCDMSSHGVCQLGRPRGRSGMVVTAPDHKQAWQMLELIFGPTTSS